MKVELEELNPCQVKLAVEVPAEVIRRELDLLYNDLRKKVQLKGFRKGKAPRPILERYYRSSVEQDLIQKIVPDSCLKVIQEKEIKAVGLPKVDEVKLEEEKSLKFTAVVDVLPSISLKPYQGLEFTRKLFKLTEEQISRELERLREANASYDSVDRPAQEGDYVVLKYRESLDGEPSQKPEESVSLVVGAGRFLAEFESHLVGMSQGSEKEFTLSFPEDFRNPVVAGKEVSCWVHLEEIKVKRLPELNDDFAREVGDYEDLEMLKGKLLKDLEENERRRAESALKNEILDRVLEENPFPVPESLVEKQIQQMLADMEAQLLLEGRSLEDRQIDMEELRGRLREPALRRIREELILDQIAGLEGIEVPESDLEEEIKRLAALTRQSSEALRARMEKDESLSGLKQRMRFDKVLSFLVSQSQIGEITVERLEQPSATGEE